MDYDEKLKTLGLALPLPPLPVASYVPAVKSGNLLFLSGMLPFVNGQLECVGKLGNELTLNQGQKAARIALLNALAVIKSEMTSLTVIQKIVQLTVYVASVPDFFEQPAVANGASDLLVEIFGETVGKHSRLALGCNVLPLNAPIELTMVVELAAMGRATHLGPSERA